MSILSLSVAPVLALSVPSADESLNQKWESLDKLPGYTFIYHKNSDMNLAGYGKRARKENKILAIEFPKEITTTKDYNIQSKQEVIGKHIATLLTSIKIKRDKNRERIKAQKEGFFDLGALNYQKYVAPKDTLLPENIKFTNFLTSKKFNKIIAKVKNLDKTKNLSCGERYFSNDNRLVSAGYARLLKGKVIRAFIKKNTDFESTIISNFTYPKRKTMDTVVSALLAQLMTKTKATKNLGDIYIDSKLNPKYLDLYGQEICGIIQRSYGQFGTINTESSKLQTKYISNLFLKQTKSIDVQKGIKKSSYALYKYLIQNNLLDIETVYKNFLAGVTKPLRDKSSLDYKNRIIAYYMSLEESDIYQERNKRIGRGRGIASISE